MKYEKDILHWMLDLRLKENQLRITAHNLYIEKCVDVNPLQKYRLMNFLKHKNEAELENLIQWIQDPNTELVNDPEDTKKLSQIDKLAKTIQAKLMKDLRKDLWILHHQTNMLAEADAQLEDGIFREYLDKMTYEDMQAELKSQEAVLEVLRKRIVSKTDTMQDVMTELDNIFGGKK